MNEKDPSPPLHVTADMVDPLFWDAYVEVDENREEPLQHRYVHGGFRGTKARFSFYFPPAERYEGRFHHNTYPLATTSDIAPFPIAFEVSTGNLGYAFDSGAYYVQTNNGGDLWGSDPSIAAYRVNAAAAKYSRIIAATIYGPHRPYGYLFGGSGGAYQTVGAAEHTSGVWDGFMPFVLCTNNAVPSIITVRMNALRTLRRRGSFAGLMDTIDAGGNGDLYSGLDAEEVAALREAMLMGFPTRGWYAHETLGSGYLAEVAAIIPPMDPTYAEDFWTKPGYLGADPAAPIAAARFQILSAIESLPGDLPGSAVLAQAPERSPVDAHLVLLDGPAAGKRLLISWADGATIGFSPYSDPVARGALHPGQRVRIDNSWALALETYQRHQVPECPAEYGWNQFRDEGGVPAYPQRGVWIGHAYTRSSAGSLLTGMFDGRMLLVQALMDIDALPWSADWYRGLVKSAQGETSSDRFALWYIDRTQHDHPQSDLAKSHVVKLEGAIQQGLRDLARWAEAGTKPCETAYRIIDTQVVVPERAGERGGPQAVVDLRANESTRAEVSVGEAVTFVADVEVPPGAGKVVSADWDFIGAGTYPQTVAVADPQSRVTFTGSHIYDQPGTYFAVLRVASQRDVDVGTRYARLENLARVRVVVR